MTDGSRASSPYEAIVFDLGGVLVAHDDRVLHERLASRCDAGSPEAVKAAVRDPRWGDGAAPVSDLHVRLRRELGYGGDWTVFLEDWCCHFALDASMLGLVGRLAEDHRVILFSNTNEEHWRFLVAASGGRLGGFEHFLSHRMGVSKPSVAAFRFVAEAAGIAPSQSLFIDDVAVNVEGARLAGFQAAVFTGEDRLRAHLAAAGIRPRG